MRERCFASSVFFSHEVCKEKNETGMRMKIQENKTKNGGKKKQTIEGTMIMDYTLSSQTYPDLVHLNDTVIVHR